MQRLLGPGFLCLFSLLLATVPVRAEEAKPEAAPETDPKVVEEQVERIIEEYDAIKSNQDLNQTRRRRELARRLGRLRHPDAVKTLLRIVENDRDLRAQIFAMNSLCRIGDMAAIKRMYKQVRREARKTVLDDYLGPALCYARENEPVLPELGPWILEKVLGNQNKILNLSAIEALGVLRVKEAREPLLAQYAKLAKSRDIHTRHELLRALGQIGGDGVKDLLHGVAESDDWRLRLAAAEVLPLHFKDGKSLDLMRELLKDEQPIVREIAAIAVGGVKLEPLFPELVVLMREGNLRAKQKAYEALTAISGQDFGYAPDVWAKWWQEKSRGGLDEKGELKSRERISVATYYNFKIFSDRVMFIIDVSGSMKWPDYEPHRIDVAKRELVKAIKALNEATLFNLATFAGHVNMWNKKGEVPATDENKKKALKWINGALLPRGATNTYGALMEGLERNSKIDTVYFLSDGIPSTGKYEVPEEIVIKLRYANRFRKVIFHTIALAMGKASIEKAQKYEDPEEMAAFMKMIADWNGGTCVDIRKPYLDLDEK